MKPSRSSSSTIIPLNASELRRAVQPEPDRGDGGDKRVRPSAMLPVIQRCVGRAKASTSITRTAAAQTITSGAINAQLISASLIARKTNSF